MVRRDDATARARQYVLNEHPELVVRTIECADAVAAGWGTETTTNPDHVADRLETVLDRAGIRRRLPAVLEGAVRAVGATVQATPIPAAPYVVVASRGPILRATTDQGRLVVTLAVFTVDRDEEGRPRYRRSAETPGEAVDVTIYRA